MTDFDFSVIIVPVLVVVALWWIHRKGYLSRIRKAFSIKPVQVTDMQLEDLKNALEKGDRDVLNRVKGPGGSPVRTYLPGSPTEIPVLSFEKNGGEIRFGIWDGDEPGVVLNKDRGRACDIKKAEPVTFVIEGKVYRGVTVDGDRGVAVKVNLDSALLELTTSAKTAWDMIEGAVLRRFIRADLTGRQILMYIIVGVVAGQLIFLWVHI